MVKHATSHGAAVIICTVAASFLIEALKIKLPTIMIKLDLVSVKLVQYFNIPLSVEVFSIILIASALSIIWGIIFKLGYYQ